MTENESLKIMLAYKLGRGCKPYYSDEEIEKAFDTAISALQEIRRYREIGTVEECKEMAVIANKKTNPDELAKIIDEWLEYSKIGTVEECREAVEKQKVKYIKIEAYCPAYCPTCRFELSESLGDGYYKYFENLSRCPKCGQKICWDENLEGME